ncbi:tumor necrosis factor receptor superfamily member 5 [Periophthalmus magnuspinnatus]|uniref:tumor necrosis factor receptor superfamily member 5 n=1 Tax=Periophthalmus magnuspinnatus TaxID=409849 RepID=UPI00145AF508|nr:tumor necrosis factor receptor superfamily member 5 [Periophthalmus magnuspinnatus]
MSRTKCKEDSYLKDGVCCKRCDAGTYKKKDCDATTETQCAKCEQGRYMATVNYLDQCRYCKTCNSQHNLRTLRECTAREDAACECVDGFYCSDSRCDHCRRVTSCPEGHGVEAPASMTNDTVCAPCDSGFFSDVSDHFSRCKPHTRCDAIGRDLKTPGTATTDAVCGGFKTQPCSWALPAGLWVGLVLTSALVFAVALFCWRRKRFGRHRVNLSRPEAPVVPVEEVQLKLPLPSKELCGAVYREETYSPSYPCDLRGYDLGEMEISCDGHVLDHGSVPTTPLKVSSPKLNGNSVFFDSSYHRTMSEPQEDEWSGT